MKKLTVHAAGKSPDLSRTKRSLLIAGICILSLLCGCQKKEEIKTEIKEAEGLFLCSSCFTIALSKDTEDREYKPLEQIRDNYRKYVVTTDYLLQKRNGIEHINIIDFMNQNRSF